MAVTGKTSHPPRKNCQLLCFFTVFLLLCSIIQFTHGLSWAALDKTQVQNGQYWRIITAHLTHSNWQHFLLNMSGCSLCLLVFRRDITTKDWLLSALFISVFSSFCMLFIHSDYGRYIGFSDTLNGWIIMGILYILPKETLLASGLLILFTGRIIYENLVPGSPFDELLDGAKVAKEAHLYGTIGGVLYSFMCNKTLRHTLPKLYKKTAKS